MSDPAIGESATEVPSPAPPAPRPASEPSDAARALLLSTLILLGCVAYGAATFALEFDTNDDAAMLGISLGLFSDRLGDPRLVHQSAFLGAGIGALFRILPAFDWYSATQWLLCLSGFGAIGFTLLRRDRSVLALASFAAVASAFVAPILFRMQFTQTSFVCLTASAALLLDAVSRPRAGRGTLGVALAFGVLSILVRSVNLVAAGIVFAFLAAGLALNWISRGEGRRAAASVALVLGFGAVLGAIAWVSNRAEGAIFYSDPAWNAFWLHQADRAFVLDHSSEGGELARVAAALERSLGITPQQLVAMLHWLPIDERIYSLESFGRMASVVREMEASSPPVLARLAARLPELIGFASSSPIFAHSAIWILALAGLQAIKKPALWPKSIAIGVGWTGLLFALIAGISLAYRLPPYRVWMPLSLLCVIGSLACHAILAAEPAPDPAHEARATSSERRILASRLSVLGLVALVGFAPLHLDFRRRASELAPVAEQLCAMTEAHVRAFRALPPGARIFIAPRVVHSECYLKPFRTRYPIELEEHVVSFGWRNLTPWVREPLFAQHDRLFDAVCADPRNMFVLHPIDWKDIEGYLRRHEPGVVLEIYSDRLPPAILTCRRGPELGPDDQLVGIRRSASNSPTTAAR